MKIKTKYTFLDIPTGSIGEVINGPEEGPFTQIEVQFPCKDCTILLAYPPLYAYEVIDDRN